jgi:predicted small lipoprotein YifL
MKIVTGMLVALAALSISACGLRGELERPVPLWGNPPNEGPNDPRTLRAQEEEKRRREAEEEAARQAEEASPTAEEEGAAEPGQPTQDAGPPTNPPQ